MAYLYYVQMDIPATHDAELNRVYDTQHVPMLSKVPGVHRVTRYRLEQSNDSRMQKYLAIYEIDSPSVVESAAWDAASAEGDWAEKIRPHTTSRHHTFFKEILKAGQGRDAQAPCIYVVQMDVPAAYEAEFNRVYDTEHVPMLTSSPGCRGGTRYAREKSNDSRMQKYAVIYELDSAEITKTKAWQEAGERGDWAPKIRPHTTSRHHSFFQRV
ncbi:MAG: hypothetical protein JO001_14740 [Alphaproteobacteria bacterium]|nr:hypothetical protein [Alphaproteobacteria bacterium]